MVYSVDQNVALLRQMTDAIAHRGPDGEGHVTLDNGNVYFGHRRLAIIDLSNYAQQPMKILDGRFTIIYNGEVYNFLELRRELIKKGYQFVSHSDTEVVVNAYAEWGCDCFKHFNGIFAVAIWDNENKRLVLARDRYGVKPLYYCKIGNQLLFASEYKAIILHPDYKAKLNYHALKEYLTFQNILTNECMLDGISLLEPGSYKILSYSDIDITNSICYWDYDFRAEETATEKEYQEELERLFRQAVKRQLVSDVDVGAYLSGGIDSGSITAIATQYLPYMKSFTCGFDLHSASGVELSYDEREKSEMMSYYFKTEHYEMVLKSGDMERCMSDLVWHLEDPRVGQSYPNMYAAKLASKFVKVVLAGSGGDELFAGYPWRYYRAVRNESFDEYIDKYYDFWQRLVPGKELDDLLKPIEQETNSIDCRDVFADVFCNIDTQDISPEQSVNYSLYFENKTFLHGLLLVEDKLSMAYGLESRVPFLDNDLVDFAMHLPVKYKLSNLSEIVRLDENDFERKKDKYYAKTRDGKKILRKVMEKHIPSEISSAVKQGFSAPDAAWFRGESIDYVKEIVQNKNSEIYNFLDYFTVNRIADLHFDGRENKRLFIWSILNLEEWCKQFL